MTTFANHNGELPKTIMKEALKLTAQFNGLLFSGSKMYKFVSIVDRAFMISLENNIIIVSFQGSDGKLEVGVNFSSDLSF